MSPIVSLEDTLNLQIDFCYRHLLLGPEYYKWPIAVEISYFVE